jgi:hypothetical protein
MCRKNTGKERHLFELYTVIFTSLRATIALLFLMLHTRMRAGLSSLHVSVERAASASAARRSLSKVHIAGIKAFTNEVPVQICILLEVLTVRAGN